MIGGSDREQPAIWRMEDRLLKASRAHIFQDPRIDRNSRAWRKEGFQLFSLPFPPRSFDLQLFVNCVALGAQSSDPLVVLSFDLLKSGLRLLAPFELPLPRGFSDASTPGSRRRRASRIHGALCNSTMIRSEPETHPPKNGCRSS